MIPERLVDMLGRDCYGHYIWVKDCSEMPLSYMIKVDVFLPDCRSPTTSASLLFRLLNIKACMHVCFLFFCYSHLYPLFLSC